jgi:alpha-L-rhamnosidase
VPALRREFQIEQPIEQARLYISALGVYDVELNGQRAIDVELAPGWTDFRQRVRYQAWDVSRFLVRGANAIGVLLADGWYSGRLGLSERQQYGDAPELIAQLEIVLADRSVQRIVTDADWRWQRSPILYADLLDGQSVDARQGLGAWTTAPYDAAAWQPVVVSARTVRLDATMSPLPRVVDELEPVGEPKRAHGNLGTRRFIYDLGQNMVGRVRVKLRAARGTHITIRHAERLDAHGDLYTANLRDARATDSYTCSGEPDETFEPRFTFHGFQYVEISGALRGHEIESMTGVVVSSGLTETGHFQCDHPLVNQLQSNVVWSQRGNFVDVPTDCPQRDERLGWTGDAQAFVRTAAFNMDIAAFYRKWLTDLADAQRPDGSVPPVAPLPPAGRMLGEMDAGPAWADAIVICPWTLYRCFGDRRILERHYGAMTAFMANLERRFPQLVRADPRVERWQGFGDWLATDAPASADGRIGSTPRDLIGTAFFCYSAQLLARIAGVLGNLSDLDRFDDLAQRIRSAFRRRFVTEEGRLVGETQTSYVLALHFGLLDEPERVVAIDWLVGDIEARRQHLSTGFVGTPYLLHVLTNHGHVDLAYRLLLQTTPPSWLYPVTQGATTIWERWDGWTDERGFQDPAMNSFNHYAYGSVGEWLYGTLAGLELDPDLSTRRNAYRHARIHPRPPIGNGFKVRFPAGPPVRYASAVLDTMFGRYETSWELSATRFRLKATVPPNCRATVVLPDGDVRHVVSGRHEFSLVVAEGEDTGPTVLHELSQVAS